jgi:hypothetical protein
MKQPFVFMTLISTHFLACPSGKINRDSYEGSATIKGYQADSPEAPFPTSSMQNFSQVIGWKDADGRPSGKPGGFSSSICG